MHNCGNECEHKLLKFCKKCAKVYCDKCGREWEDPCTRSHMDFYTYTLSSDSCTVSQ